MRAVAATFALAEPLAAFAEVLGRALLADVAPAGPGVLALQLVHARAQPRDFGLDFQTLAIFSAMWASYWPTLVDRGD